MELMIVDDEEITREGLAASIDWARFGIRVCALAANGAEALALAQKQPVDILITDVKMPLMDGIALSERMRALNRSVRIVFVSGFSELDYLKSAIRVNVADYILKPVDVGELQAAVERIASDIRAERANLLLNLAVEEKLRSSMPALRERFLLRLLRLGPQDEETLPAQLAFYEIGPMAGARAVAFVLLVDDFETAYASLSPEAWQSISLGIVSVMQEVVDALAGGFALEDAQDRFAALVWLTGSEEGLEQQVDELSRGLHRAVNRRLGISATLGVGLWVERLALVHESYRHALSAAKMRLHKGRGQIIYLGQGAEGQLALSPVEVMGQAFSDALRLGDDARALQLLRGAFQEVRRGAPDHSRVLALCLSILPVIALCRETYRLESRADIVADIRAILLMQTVDDMEALLRERVSEVCASLARRSQARMSIAQQLKATIEARYAQDLTIKQLAGEVYVTPAYLCMLFKQETGDTINEYLTRVRLNKARELLLTKRYKLYEVAQMVGYADTKYFGRLFRQHVGVNPSQYEPGAQPPLAN